MDEIIKTLAEILSNEKIAYMVAGGQAVIAYGEPRLTQDIDITIALPAESYRRVLQVLDGPFVPLFGGLDEFVKSSWVLPIKHLATSTTVDLTFTETIFEIEAISHGRKIDVGGIAVNFISPEDLIVEKIFAGRTKDLLDVENILNIQRSKLDLSAIESKIKAFDKDLGQTDLFELWKPIKNKYDNKRS